MSSGTSTSGATSSAASAVVLEDGFRPTSTPLASDLVQQPSIPGLTQPIPFSSGNPRIEETRGIMYLFPGELLTSPSDLPVGRKPLVCVIAVPNHMTYADFCQFCGSFIQHMLEMRIVRIDGSEDKYSVLLRFDDQGATDGFYRHFNGKRFSSMELDVCHMRFTLDVQYTGSIEHTQSVPISSTDQPTCPVCLERLDQDSSGILTTICNHSFHCSCISNWTDSSCPVCRYCQQQPEKSTCSVCGTSENLRMCLICGFTVCESGEEGHATQHWMETQHCYSLVLDSQLVWNFVGDNYVHRLIQSKTDGKLVEFCAHADEMSPTFEGSSDSEITEAICNSKLDIIHMEYRDLLKSQLDNQRKHYESLLQEVKEETENEITEAIEKATSFKLHKIQAKLDKCVEEKKFVDEINGNLLKNQEIWKAKNAEIEQREEAAVRLKDQKIMDLEKQFQDLMAQIEAQTTLHVPPDLSP